MRQSLNKHLLRYLVKDTTHQMTNSVRLYRLLEDNDFAGLESLFQAFFASIPLRCPVGVDTEACRIQPNSNQCPGDSR